jgi:hypothetical protein
MAVTSQAPANVSSSYSDTSPRCARSLWRNAYRVGSGLCEVPRKPRRENLAELPITRPLRGWLNDVWRDRRGEGEKVAIFGATGGTGQIMIRKACHTSIKEVT